MSVLSDQQATRRDRRRRIISAPAGFVIAQQRSVLIAPRGAYQSYGSDPARTRALTCTRPRPAPRAVAVGTALRRLP